jgi:hypothetical protein
MAIRTKRNPPRFRLETVAMDVENLKGGMASAIEVIGLMRKQIAELQRKLGIQTADARELAKLRRTVRAKTRAKTASRR